MNEKKHNKSKIFAIIISLILGINLAFTSYLFGKNIQSSLKESAQDTKYTLYIGTNDKDTYKEEIPFDECLQKVTAICVKYTDGCTIYEATGYWKDDKENITTERTIVSILESIAKETVYKICDELIIALNQNSILIETNRVSSLFYSSSSK